MSTVKIALLSGRNAWCSHIRKVLGGCDTPFELLDPLLKGANLTDADMAIVDVDWLNGQGKSWFAEGYDFLSVVPTLAIVDQWPAASVTPLRGEGTHALPVHALTPEVMQCTVHLLLQNVRLKTEVSERGRRYHSLFFNAVDPAFYLDESWRILQVNEAFAETFGQNADDMAGASFSAIFHNPDDFERVKSRFSESNHTQLDDEIVFKFLDRKGRFLGHIKISLLKEHSGIEQGTDPVRHFQGFLSNISYRERLRKIKERADRVDMTYRLARTLAHEIRNPLTNINLALEHIKDEAFKNDNPSAMWAIIRRASQRINGLIDQLLTSSERSQLLIENCDLSQMLVEIAAAYQDRADMLKAKIQTDIEVAGIEYPCDAQKIKLAISNLVSNAVEALGDSDGLITIGSYVEEGYFVVYVEDNGEGMTDEVKKGLFDPFFTRKEGGVGLGLTAAQTIIAEHEGEIEVESEWGHGSTFTISLPLRKVSDLHLPTP